MLVQINTDHNVHGTEAVATELTEVVEAALQRFSDRITRVVVHIGDENGPKGGKDDIRCLLEARLEGRQPIVVTHHASTVLLAVHSAAGDMAKVIESTLGRAEHAIGSRA